MFGRPALLPCPPTVPTGPYGVERRAEQPPEASALPERFERQPPPREELTTTAAPSHTLVDDRLVEALQEGGQWHVGVELLHEVARLSGRDSNVRPSVRLHVFGRHPTGAGLRLCDSSCGSLRSLGWNREGTYLGAVLVALEDLGRGEARLLQRSDVALGRLEEGGELRGSPRGRAAQPVRGRESNVRRSVSLHDWQRAVSLHDWRVEAPHRQRAVRARVEAPRRLLRVGVPRTLTARCWRRGIAAPGGRCRGAASDPATRRRGRGAGAWAAAPSRSRRGWAAR